jgi:hypothetical protein
MQVIKMADADAAIALADAERASPIMADLIARANADASNALAEAEAEVNAGAAIALGEDILGTASLATPMIYEDSSTSTSMPRTVEGGAAPRPGRLRADAPPFLPQELFPRLPWRQHLTPSPFADPEHPERPLPTPVAQARALERIRTATDTVDVLSLMQPFAGLLLHGTKTLETRTSPILKRWARRLVYVHMARSQWPQSKGGFDVWRAVADPELSTTLDDGPCEPPPQSGISPGMICGWMEVGATRTIGDWAEQLEGGWEEVERRTLLPRALLQGWATEVTRCGWLPRGVFAKPSAGGVWRVEDAHTRRQLLGLVCTLPPP